MSASPLPEKPVWIGQLEEDFFAAIAVLDNAEEARCFLLDLFTPKEITRAATRWCLARQMYGPIADKGSAPCYANKNTVSRVRGSIVNHGTGFSREIYERLLNKTDSTATE